ncbi:carbon catabolite repressor protein [Acrasis kona]|uniref:Carbon catabolite repressor protein n=1 Tax=Acrasis kona TaxID=1008807 RepID=A0AAW2YJN6_9EUKA
MGNEYSGSNGDEENTVTEDILIELENNTPIVGIEIVPSIEVTRMGACIFEWHRMPALGVTSSNADSTTDLVLAGGASSGSNISIDVQSIKSRIPVLISQGANYTPTNDDVHHKLRFSVVLIGNHKTNQHGVTASSHIVRKEVLMRAAIPLPEKTPARKWVKNKILVKAKRMHYPPLSHDRVQYSLSYHQKRINCRFKVLSYDLFGDDVLRIIKAKTDKNSPQYVNTLPRCPSFVTTEVYRRKVLYRELVSYNADLMCLQRVNAREYDRWYLDLSKIGYSGLFKAQQQQKAPSEDMEATIDYSDQSKFGCAILYRRSRFNRVKDWVIKLSDECIKSSVDQLFQSKLISATTRDSCHSHIKKHGHKVVGMIMELEFKESKDMIQYMKTYTVKGSVDVDYEEIKLLCATLMVNPCMETSSHHEDVHSPEDEDVLSLRLIQALQAHALMTRLDTIPAEQQYKLNKSKACLVIGGNLCGDDTSLAYKYLSRMMSSEQQQQASNRYFQIDTETQVEMDPLKNQDEEEEEQAVEHIEEEEEEPVAPTQPERRMSYVAPLALLNRRSIPDVASPTQTEPEETPISAVRTSNIHLEPSLENTDFSEFDTNVLSEIKHYFRLESCYAVSTGQEIKYPLNNKNRSMTCSRDVIFYGFGDMIVRSVAREAPGRAYPNMYFVSQQVALFAEMELSLMMKKIDEENPPIEEQDEDLFAVQSSCDEGVQDEDHDD